MISVASVLRRLSRRVIGPSLWMMSGYLLVVAAISTAAQELPSLEEVQQEIAQALKARVDSEIDIKTLTHKLKLTHPVEPPRLTIDEINTQIAAAIEKEVNRKPSRSEDDYREEAQKKYPVFVLKETVTLYFRDGRAVTGRLYSTDGEYVKVGDRRYSKQDLTKDSARSLDPVACANAIERYVRNKKLWEEDRRAAITEKIRSKFGKKLYAESGYIWRKNGWVSKSYLLDRAISWKRRKLEKKYLEEVVVSVYESYGFRRDGDEWKPPEVVTDPATESAAGHGGVRVETDEDFMAENAIGRDGKAVQRVSDTDASRESDEAHTELDVPVKMPVSTVVSDGLVIRKNLSNRSEYSLFENE